MNVWAVTYEFNGTAKVLIVESKYTHPDDVRGSLHPAISTKVTHLEFVGALA